MPNFLRIFLLIAAITVSGAGARADSAIETEPAGALSASDLEIYRKALDAVRKGRGAEARKIAAQGGDPLATKLIQWFDLTEPGSVHLFEELRAFIEANPDWPDQSILEAEAERAMPDGMDAETVLQWFGDRQPRTVRGTVHLARALVERGLEEQAAKVVRRDWIGLDMSASDERYFLALFGRFLEPRHHVARLDRLLWDRQRGPARRMLQRVDKQQRALAEARLKLMYRRSGVDEAIAAVPPELAHDPGLIYDRAVWRRRHGKPESVIELLDRPFERIPHPDQFWKEMQNAARLALDRGDASAAYRLAKSHGATEGITFAEGEWLAGWIALRFLSEHQTAYAHFTRLYAGVSSSISQARGAYWAGRAAEAMGDLALARNWYKTAAGNLTTFYGQLAAHRLGQDGAMQFPPPPEPTDREQAAFEANELVRVVRILAQLGAKDALRPFALRLTEQAESPGEYRLIADLAAGIGRDDLAVLAAREARRRGVELVEYLYPVRSLPDGVDAEQSLILAVMRQESGFDSDAVSYAGARGLMQLMPATARHMARRLDLRYSRKRLMTDPEFNIRLGSAYLDALLHRVDGSYLLAIAAYNAGPSRVNEWIRLYGDPRRYGVDPIDWIEKIPFAETRNYVQRVLENLQVYRHRLGEPLLAFSLRQDIGGRPDD